MATTFFNPNNNNNNTFELEPDSFPQGWKRMPVDNKHTPWNSGIIMIVGNRYFLTVNQTENLIMNKEISLHNFHCNSCGFADFFYEIYDCYMHFVCKNCMIE